MKHKGHLLPVSLVVGPVHLCGPLPVLSSHGLATSCSFVCLNYFCIVKTKHSKDKTLNILIEKRAKNGDRQKTYKLKKRIFNSTIQRNRSLNATFHTNQKSGVLFTNGSQASLYCWWEYKLELFLKAIWQNLFKGFKWSVLQKFSSNWEPINSPSSLTQECDS